MVEREGLTRRQLLELGAVATATAGVAALPAYARTGKTKRPAGRPKNIIFMVSDGMSMGALSLAEPFSQIVRKRGTHWYRLMRDPSLAHGHFDTGSLKSLVTDSAAASTAWATGTRVFNGSINVLPDGTRLTPIGQLAQQSGRRVGLVTTTRITHATPAGFATVQPQRNDEHEIAPQFKGVADVLMGGGHKFFDPQLRGDDRDVIAEYKQAGYTCWDHRRQVRGTARPDKVLGLFYDDHIPYTIDHVHDAELAAQVPTLAEMTSAALDILSRHRDGFLLQVEGGRIDHAAHANDGAGILWDQLAFDDALEVALQFAERDPDTLVIVTTDHGNANPGLNGMGGAYRDSNECFEKLGRANVSVERLHGRLRATKDSADDTRALLLEATGLEVTPAEARAVAKAIAGQDVPELNRQHANWVGVLGQVLGNHNGIGWTGVTHTADLVELTALGPGSDHFRGLLLNTDAYDHLTRLWGIDHRNPQMSPQAAAAYPAPQFADPYMHAVLA